MNEELKTKPCTGHQKGGKCKTPLLWGVTTDGKKVPLDTKAVVFRIAGQKDGQFVLERADDCYVTHFATCRDVDLFKK